MLWHSISLCLLSLSSVLWFSGPKPFTSWRASCTTLFESSESGVGKTGSWREGCPLSPPCLPSGYLWCRCAGPSPSPLPTSEPPLGILFESECSLYYWNVHKRSPNAWPVSKSPRYTYIWLSIWDHQIFCNKEKPEQQLSVFSLSLELLELNVPVE